MILNSRIIGSSQKKIIILHGLLGSLDNWITFGKKISNEGFEVHLVDQRNHGKSFHSNQFSYENMANDLKNYFKDSDLVVLPYNKIFQSGVLLLSMSYGRAVLCSDLKPFKEIIEHNKSGYLFENGNFNDLADKIIDIYNNRKLIPQIIENANSLLHNKYDWEIIGKSTKKLYEKI